MIFVAKCSKVRFLFWLMFLKIFANNQRLDRALTKLDLQQPFKFRSPGEISTSGYATSVHCLSNMALLLRSVLKCYILRGFGESVFDRLSVVACQMNDLSP